MNSANPAIKDRIMLFAGKSQSEIRSGPFFYGCYLLLRKRFLFHGRTLQAFLFQEEDEVFDLF